MTGAVPDPASASDAEVKVFGVPSVVHRDGGQAMTNALPITSLTGTVAEFTLQVELSGPSVPASPQW